MKSPVQRNSFKNCLLLVRTNLKLGALIHHKEHFLIMFAKDFVVTKPNIFLPAI